MHYYKRNIGDYHRKAGRLSMLEHGAYTLIMDACYDREKFPTKEQAVDWCLARTPEEVDAVEFVLSKFFSKSDDGLYIQNHIMEDLEKYQENASKNKQIAIDREKKKRELREKGKHEPSTNRAPTVHESAPNHKPITINHKPVTSKTTTKKSPAIALDYSVWPELPSDQVLADWLEMRKRLKANVSQTVINNFTSELNKAAAEGRSVDYCLSECVTRNWRGFKYSWVQESQNAIGQNNFGRNKPTREQRIDKALDEAFGVTDTGAIEGDFETLVGNGFDQLNYGRYDSENMG